MFQPLPTAFTSSCFASYGLATDQGYSFPEPAGGGGAGCQSGLLYNSQPPLPLHQQQQQQQQTTSRQLQAQQRSFQQQQVLQQQRAPPLHVRQRQPSLPSSHSISPSHSASPQHLQVSPYQFDRIPIKMEEHQPQQDEHDIAAQQAAARDYRPVLEGALVGNKTPIEAITQQYAQADQTYVEKTMALPRDYSQYRPIQGDGNCGWRAIGFSYFEKLIESGFLHGELARLTSLNDMIIRSGAFSYFDDWADAFVSLMRLVAGEMDNPAMAQMVLEEQWNDSGVTSPVIYYLRLLASFYLKQNAEDYEPFVTEHVGGVQGYCSSTIEIVDKEIENIGIVALVNILLKPAGLVLEIAYLDLSPGSEVNTFRFPEEANGKDPADLGPIIYLLYRPTHYDILYRAPAPPPVPVPAAPISMQVNRVASFSHNTAFTDTQTDLGAYSTMDYSMLAMIPGLSAPMAGMAPLAPPPPAPACSTPDSYSPVQQSPWMTQFSDTMSAPALTPQPAPEPPIGVTPQPPTPPESRPPAISLATRTKSIVTTSKLGRQGSMAPTKTGYQIRFSPVQLEYENKTKFPEPTFQVSSNTFKNSVWNRAHYGNPDFHPEEWVPDDEHSDGRLSHKKKVKQESAN